MARRQSGPPDGGSHPPSVGGPVRTGLRLLMVAVGVVLFLFYLSAAYAASWLLVSVWRARPDPETTLLAVLVATAVLGYLSYRTGTARLLASLDAVELTRERAPDLHRRLDRLCARMDVERPALLLAQVPTPNAFALGGHGNVVVLDRGLFEVLDGDEFEALLAHELAHLESYDGLVQTLGYSFLRTVVGVVTVVVLPAVLLLTGLARSLAWIAGRPVGWADNPAAQIRARVETGVLLVMFLLMLPLFAHSRRREYAADDRAAAVTHPLAMARALYKLQRAARPEWGLLSTLYTRGDEDAPLSGLFSTHPSTEDRIERLVERARRGREPRGGDGARRIPVD